MLNYGFLVWTFNNAEQNKLSEKGQSMVNWDFPPSRG